MTKKIPNAANSGRDPKTGRFLTGNFGGGRPKGSRNKLTTEFLDALYAEFQVSGAAAIKKVAEKEPAKFLNLIAALLPKELDVALSVESDLLKEARDFAEAYRFAKQYIGAEDNLPMVDVTPETEPVGHGQDRD